MKRTQKILMCELTVTLALAAALIVLFEADVLEAGGWFGNGRLEFAVLSVMEMIVLIGIPLALRLFRFKAVRRRLTARPASALLAWGTLRLALICVPLLLCTLFYYLFSMKAAFGYLAIILLLSLGFIVPTRDKCEAETTPISDGDNQQQP